MSFTSCRKWAWASPSTSRQSLFSLLNSGLQKWLLRWMTTNSSLWRSKASSHSTITQTLTLCQVPPDVFPSRITDRLNQITNSRSLTLWLRSRTFVIHFLLTLPSDLPSTKKAANEKWVESRIIRGLSIIPWRVQSWRYGWYQCLYWIPVNPHRQR